MIIPYMGACGCHVDAWKTYGKLVGIPHFFGGVEIYGPENTSNLPDFLGLKFDTRGSIGTAMNGLNVW